MALCCCGKNGQNSIIAKCESQVKHLEEVGLTRCPAPRLRAEESAVPVCLNVYSLIERNGSLSKIGLGVFHSGVVVYGIEWSYGEVLENPDVSGLFCVHPGQAAGTLYKTIKLGHTTRSPAQVDTILHRLENEWRSADYHILHHNCNNFSQAFCNLLSTVEKLDVPAWCNRVARVGDRVVPRKLATKIQRLCDEEPPKAMKPAPRVKVNEMPVSIIPRGWYLHPSIAQPPRYVHFFSDDDDNASLRTYRMPRRRNARANLNNNSSGSFYGNPETDSPLTGVSTRFSSLYGQVDDIPPPPGFTAEESAAMVVRVAKNLPPDSRMPPPVPLADDVSQATSSMGVPNGSGAFAESSQHDPRGRLTGILFSTTEVGNAGRDFDDLSDPVGASVSGMSIPLSTRADGGHTPVHYSTPTETDEVSLPLPLSSVEVAEPYEASSGYTMPRRERSALLWRPIKKKPEHKHTEPGQSLGCGASSLSEKPIFASGGSAFTQASETCWVPTLSAGEAEGGSGSGGGTGAAAGQSSPLSAQRPRDDQPPPPSASSPEMLTAVAISEHRGHGQRRRHGRRRHSTKETVERQEGEAPLPENVAQSLEPNNPRHQDLDSFSASQLQPPDGSPPSEVLRCHSLEATALPDVDSSAPVEALGGSVLASADSHKVLDFLPDTPPPLSPPNEPQLLDTPDVNGKARYAKDEEEEGDDRYLIKPTHGDDTLYMASLQSTPFNNSDPHAATAAPTPAVKASSEGSVEMSAALATDLSAMAITNLEMGKAEEKDQATAALQKQSNTISDEDVAEGFPLRTEADADTPDNKENSEASSGGAGGANAGAVARAQATPAIISVDVREATEADGIDEKSSSALKMLVLPLPFPPSPLVALTQLTSVGQQNSGGSGGGGGGGSGTFTRRSPRIQNLSPMSRSLPTVPETLAARTASDGAEVVQRRASNLSSSQLDKNGFQRMVSLGSLPLMPAPPSLGPRPDESDESAQPPRRVSLPVSGLSSPNEREKRHGKNSGSSGSYSSQKTSHSMTPSPFSPLLLQEDSTMVARDAHATSVAAGQGPWPASTVCALHMDPTLTHVESSTASLLGRVTSSVVVQDGAALRVRQQPGLGKEGAAEGDYRLSGSSSST